MGWGERGILPKPCSWVERKCQAGRIWESQDFKRRQQKVSERNLDIRIIKDNLVLKKFDFE